MCSVYHVIYQGTVGISAHLVMFEDYRLEQRLSLHDTTKKEKELNYNKASVLYGFGEFSMYWEMNRWAKIEVSLIN